MARSETQTLIAQLKLEDQLSGPLAAAKQNLVQTETAVGRIGATAQASGAQLGGLTSSLTGVAKAGALAFAGFTALNIGSDFLGGAISAAKEAEVSTTKLTAALEANVTAFDGNTAAIEAAIQARTRLGFDDETLRNSFSQLVSATHNVNEALDAQAIAIDLARARGISLGEASQALTNIEGGRYRALATLGIQIKANASQEEALAAVQKVVSGQAEAFATTTAGKLEAATARINEAQERLGKVALPAVATAFGLAADAADAFATSLDNVSTQSGTISASAAPPLINALSAAVTALHAGTDAAAGFIGQLTSAAPSLADTARESLSASEAADRASGAFDDLTTVAGHTSDFFHQFTTDAKDTGAGLDDIALKAQAAGQGLDTSLAPALKRGIDDTQTLIDNLLSIPTTIESTVRVNIIQTTQGVGAQPIPQPLTAGGGGDQNLALNSRGQVVTVGGDTGAHGDTTAAEAAAAEARRRALQAQEEAARKAKQAAEELARAYRERVSVEFDHAKKTADTLFDALHARIDKAIDDAEKLAQKQHDAALQSIKDNLAAEEAAHAAPVNAAEQALAETQAREQRRNLLEAKQAAQQALATNIDPTQTASLARQLRDATEALANFDAAAAIDRLKAAQAAQDAASQATANAATAVADAKLQAAKDEAQKERDAETLAAKKRKDDFETQLAALEKRDTALGKTPKQIQADIDALEKRFGITTDALGFHHIQDPLVSAIKDIKIEPPQVVINNNQKYVLQIGPHELRLIASAAQQANQPQASASVRTGANGRG